MKSENQVHKGKQPPDLQGNAATFFTREYSHQAHKGKPPPELQRNAATKFTRECRHQICNEIQQPNLQGNTATRLGRKYNPQRFYRIVARRAEFVTEEYFIQLNYLYKTFGRTGFLIQQIVGDPREFI